MSNDERQELCLIRVDLEAEEVDQAAERGYASPKLVRAIARLDQLLDSRDDNVIALNDVQAARQHQLGGPP